MSDKGKSNPGCSIRIRGRGNQEFKKKKKKKEKKPSCTIYQFLSASHKLGVPLKEPLPYPDGEFETHPRSHMLCLSSCRHSQPSAFHLLAMIANTRSTGTARTPPNREQLIVIWLFWDGSRSPDPTITGARHRRSHTSLRGLYSLLLVGF